MNKYIDKATFKTSTQLLYIKPLCFLQNLEQELNNIYYQLF